MLVPIRMSTNMAAGNQRKGLASLLLFRQLLFPYELVYKHVNIFPIT